MKQYENDDAKVRRSNMLTPFGVHVVAGFFLGFLNGHCFHRRCMSFTEYFQSTMLAKPAHSKDDGDVWRATRSYVVRYVIHTAVLVVNRNTQKLQKAMQL